MWAIFNLLQGFRASFNQDALPQVKTEARFYKPLEIHRHEKPYECEFNVSAVAQAKRTNIELEEHSIIVRDIRGFERQFTLERNGFEVMQHHSALSRAEFQSRAEIEARYLPECEEIVRLRYKAWQVIILGFNIRDNAEGNSNVFAGALRPVRTVHVDQSRGALFSRLVQQVGKETAQELVKKRRCLIVNVWRPLSDPIEEYPLSYCDIQTVKSSDCVPVDLVKRDNYEGESLYLRYNPAQRFYYVSHQRPHEITLMKMAETNPLHPNAIYQGLPHVAFPLPYDENNPSPPPRESIEVRALVLI